MAFLLNSQSKRITRPLFGQLYSPYMPSSQVLPYQGQRFSTQTTAMGTDTKTLKRSTRRIKDDLMELTKFKLSGLNAIASFTMFFYHAPLAGVGLLPTLTFLFATQTIAMSTQCFGQVVEANKDAQMVRTQNRPIPKGNISSKHGCFIGTGLSVMSFMAYTQFMPYTWLISNAVWFSYLCVYLPMKQSSPWNTFFGAIVGALPPLIGTMAQTGAMIDYPTFLLASYIFSWQFPHFYGILYENKDDYKKAGFKMLSNVDPQGKQAFAHIAACSVLNTIVPLLMTNAGILHPVLLVPFYYYQAKYLQAVMNFKKEEASVQSAKKLKRTAYLPFIILLAGFMMTTGINRHKKRQENLPLEEGVVEEDKE